jgi:hypothetical protein
MKNILIFIGIIALVTVIGFTILSCGAPGGDVNNGTISINLNGSLRSARDVMPWPTDDPDILNKIDFVITLTGPGNTKTLNARAEGNIRASVSPGQWQVKVVANLQDVVTPLSPNGEPILSYATGLSSVDAKTGQTSNVSIPMTANFCRGCDYTDPTLATCTEPSKATVICSIDSSHNGETIITQALGHAYGAWDTTATCTAAGTETRTCTRNCGETGDTDTRPVGALGHLVNSWDWTTYNSSAGRGVSCTRTGCTGGGLPVIGDTGPGGGIIFYVAPTTGYTVEGYGNSGDAGYFASYTAYYLEAAPNDISGNPLWASRNSDLIPGLSQNQNDETDRAIGRGRMNTEIIIAHGIDNGYTTPAASACAVLGTDWFLPSLNELYELYKLYQTNGKGSYGNLTPNMYWSSSQYNTSQAWFHNFIINVNNYFVKDNSTYYVRAVRAF